MEFSGSYDFLGEMAFGIFHRLGKFCFEGQQISSSDFLSLVVVYVSVLCLKALKWNASRPLARIKESGDPRHPPETRSQ